jgi:hypothetical protein
MLRRIGLRLQVIFPAFVLIACGAISAMAWVERPAPIQPPVPAAMDILRDTACLRAETKTILVRGTEDNHAPTGSEPNFLRPGRQFPDSQSFFADGSYDQVQPNRRVTDSFRVPANVAGGRFLIRLKPVAGNDSDTLAIGDLGTVAFSGLGRASMRPNAPQEAPGWTRQGELYHASLADIRLNVPAAPGRPATTRRLLDFIRDGAADGWVDFMVQDDTSVDFAALALCLEPPRGKGLTLGSLVGPPLPTENMVALTCSHGDRNQNDCNPYFGDMACSVPLPVACFRPGDAPIPADLPRGMVRAIWSGGDLAFTEPVPGSRFATSGQVDRFCAARFGPGWRTARWHDGPSNSSQGIAGFSQQSRPTSRVWIDIVGSPYATCWKRP